MVYLTGSSLQAVVGICPPEEAMSLEEGGGEDSLRSVCVFEG